MGSYFGATLPHNSNQRKRLVVPGLLAFAGLSLGCFFFTATNLKDSLHSFRIFQTEVEQKLIAQSPQTEVLVAKVLIKQDTRLSPELFGTVTIEESQVPLGAIRAAQANQIYGKFAANVIAPQVLITSNDISYRQKDIIIPAGYRAIAVAANDDGAIQPNSKVNVLLTFSQNGVAKVTTLASRAQVIDVNTRSAQGERVIKTAPKSFTLLVQTADASRIELAKSMGSISLTHEKVDSERTPLASLNPYPEDSSSVISVSNLSPQEQADGSKRNRVLIKDALGKTLVYVLNEAGGGWVLETQSS